MNLPQDFHFSQSSLQDFVDCCRRFELRYLLQLAWPAVESEPVLENERFMQQGSAFHLMVHQLLLGIPANRLAALAQNPDLLRWWDSFRAAQPDLWQPENVVALHPEFSLVGVLDGWKLVAKVDLLLQTRAGVLQIFDWKTARKLPRREKLAERLQTRLYPSLLARAGAALFGSVTPEQIEMIYWFTDYPDQAVRFPYGQGQLAADEIYLTNLIREIQRLKPGEFPLTSDEKKCAYCVYRSFCERGGRAGDSQETDWDDESQLGAAPSLDFDQIAEIEF
jgi:hypothetical protein